MNKRTYEVYLNCKEQGLEDYCIEAYYEITMNNLFLRQQEIEDGIQYS